VGVWVNRFQNDVPAWILVIPALLFLWPLSNQLKRRFKKLVLSGDKLRYETGVLSRTTRTIQVSKIQDVRVDQTLTERLMGIGNISIETAGEASRLRTVNIDDPQSVADAILDAGPAAPRKTDSGLA
jgi:uncharacterized membrane protein YdbT with pleckstrin-like domain